MKRWIKRIAAIVAALFLLSGVVFSVMRPSYVREAWSILFSNELTEEKIAEENGLSLE